MNRTLSIFGFSIVLAMFMACNGSENKKLIIGEWKAIDWQVEGKPSGYSAENVHFMFDEEKEYTYRYGDYMETGKYFISNNQLHTTPEGGITMMVKIIKLNSDTLVMDMNRGGQAERLTLLKN